MVKIEFFHRNVLDDPEYQHEIARLLDLCGEARTWESVWALQVGGEGHRALEVGGWPLNFSRALKDRYEHVVATDSFEWCGRTGCKEGNPTAGEWMEQLGAGVETQQADARRLPWGDKHFDAVYAVSVLEHIPEDEEALQEMLRVGRRVVVTTDIAPDPAGYFNYGRIYSPETLRGLLHRVTGQSVQVGEFPPSSAWMYPGFTCCGFVVEG